MSSVHDFLYRSRLRQCGERYLQMSLSCADTQLYYFIQNEFLLYVDSYPLNKLNRWLGYIQGVLISNGVTSVDNERNFTRPLFRPLDFPEEN
jgi:hypothetical protein